MVKAQSRAGQWGRRLLGATINSSISISSSKSSICCCFWAFLRVWRIGNQHYSKIGHAKRYHMGSTLDHRGLLLFGIH